MDKKKAVLISCYGWYERRLQYVDKYLQQREYETVLLISDYNHIKKRKDMHLSMQDNQIDIRNIHVPAYKKTFR